MSEANSVPPPRSVDTSGFNPIAEEACTTRGPVDNLLEFAETYFRPKSFESEALYRHLGVGIFRKISPGDWLARRAGDGSLLEEQGTRKERVGELERYRSYAHWYDDCHECRTRFFQRVLYPGVGCYQCLFASGD